MIKIINGFPDNVVGASATGRVTREDHDGVLIPRIEIMAKRHSRIRCYYEIGTDFAGIEAVTVWKDCKIAVEYWMQWDRVAVLTDVTWIPHLAKALRFFTPFQMRVYELKEKDMARIWILWP
jgi:SpoIIAA-like